MLVLACVHPLQIVCGPEETCVHRVGKLLHGKLQPVNVPVVVEFNCCAVVNIVLLLTATLFCFLTVTFLF